MWKKGTGVSGQREDESAVFSTTEQSEWSLMDCSAEKSGWVRESRKEASSRQLCSFCSQMTLSTPSHLESQTPYVLMTWPHGLLPSTPPQSHIQGTINRLSSWADVWCTKINCSKTQATLFSLSTVKEKMMLKLDNMPVPQVDNPTFLGVTLVMRLTQHIQRQLWQDLWES